MTETAGAARPARPVRRRRPRGPVLEGPARASAHVCQAASCLSAQSDQVFDALAEQVTAAGLDRRGRQAGRLPGAVRRRSPGRGSRERPAVRAGRPGRPRRPRRRAPGRPARRDPGATGAVLRPAGAGGDRELGPGRPRGPGRLPHPGRLPGAGDGADRDDPGRGGRPGRPQRPAGPGRGRLPDRPEVDDGGQGRRRAEVRDLQRRRRRPRGVHGPQRPGERPPPGAGGHGHRRLRRRGQPRLRLLPGRVPAGHQPGSRPPSARPAGPGCSAPASPTPPSSSTSSCGWAPGRSCAARRRP